MATVKYPGGIISGIKTPELNEEVHNINVTIEFPYLSLDTDSGVFSGRANLYVDLLIDDEDNPGEYITNHTLLGYSDITFID